jgi:hypothetical protein
MTGFTPGRENGHRRPKGYAPWRPQRKTQVLLAQVAEVLEEYVDQLPLTIRQIFYRLVGAYAYEKTENAYERLCNHLGRARRARRVAFSAIRDDGVTVIRHNHYDGVADFHEEIAHRARAYRRDRQGGQPVYMELWCEAAGMLHQLDRVASRYSVPAYTNSGFHSITANYEIAERAMDRDRPTVILHVGDYDPSGESLFEVVVEDAAAFVEDDRTIRLPEVRGVRVALTAEQVEERDLPTEPPKQSDSRSKSWKGARTCQLEALAPDVLARLVEDAILDHLDLDVFDAQIEQERAERAELLALPPGPEVSET